MKNKNSIKNDKINNLTVIEILQKIFKKNKKSL